MGIFPVGLEHERGDSMSKDEALRMALEALEELNETNSYWWQDVDEATVGKIDPAIIAIKQALAAPVQGPDWKAEYLKSVESGCITLDELREALAELEATNRQVEILSDALAESRREVAAQRTWVGSGDLEDSNAYQTPPAAQPAVPDAITDRSEHPEYVQGWNDCRLLMLRGMKP
jgi:hypothetical protein